MIYTRFLSAATLLFFVGVMPVNAQGAPQDFRGLVSIFLDIIGLIIPFIFALALLVFLWGLTRAWILGAGDEKNVTAGKQIAFAGILGLVVMTAVWAIVELVRSSIFGF
jgi:hypothetical protein